jgi:nicotinate phosphoribosyltransferase
MRANAPIGNRGLALFTDLYELTMLQAYFERGMREKAIFDLFFRRLPSGRNYLLACGLADALDYLESLHFDEDDIAYLRDLKRFSEPFLASLRAFRFTGDVHAVPEGTPVFPNEPLLQVEAPLPEAQLAETFLMNQIHFQTLAASKAARVVHAAQGRTVVDFGMRRMHGTDAGLKGARAFHVAGVDATSNVLAGSLYGVPVAGTMAHSFVQAFDDEREAFRAFARTFRDSIVLVDTYDTLEGVRRVIELMREPGSDFAVRGIRLDSGDLAKLALEARRLLDAAGLARVEIFASGGLDEHSIAGLVSEGAPIDGFGVGSRMGVSADAPYLDMAYKLSSHAGRGRIKLSPKKSNLPGAKQVFRTARGDRAAGDVLAARGEVVEGRPLLVPVMRAGRRCEAGEAGLAEARRRAREELEHLPAACRRLEPMEAPYPVELSAALATETERLRQELGPAGAGHATPGRPPGEPS